MSSPPVILPRDVVLAKIPNTKDPGEKTRSCVVTRVERDYIEIIYGQSEYREVEQIAVDVGTPGFSEVTNKTYFRIGNVHLISPKRFVKKCGRCGLELFSQFVALVEKAHAQRLVVPVGDVAKLLAAKAAANAKPAAEPVAQTAPAATATNTAEMVAKAAPGDQTPSK